MVKSNTVVREVSLWNKIQIAYKNPSDFWNDDMVEFYRKIGSSAKSDGTYRLAKNIMDNERPRKTTNNYLDSRKVSKKIIKRMVEKETASFNHLKEFKSKHSDYKKIEGKVPKAFKDLKNTKYSKTFKSLPFRLSKSEMSNLGNWNYIKNKFVLKDINEIKKQLVNYKIRKDRVISIGFSQEIDIYRNNIKIGSQTVGQKASLCKTTTLLENKINTILSYLDNFYLNVKNRSHLNYYIKSTTIHFHVYRF